MVGAWTVKTAMVGEQTVEDAQPYWRDDERQAFRETGRTRGDTQVVAAAYRGSGLVFINPGLFVVKRISAEGEAAPAVNTTLMVGALVLQVRANRYTEVTGRILLNLPSPGVDRTILLWPPGGDSAVQWLRPGTVPFDTEALHLFAHGRPS